MESVNTPGTKTSEFRAVLMYIALMIADATPWVDFSDDSMWMAFSLIALYGGERFWQKLEAIKKGNAIAELVRINLKADPTKAAGRGEP